MEQIMTAICDSIIAILTAISQFDIMAVDQTRLAEFGQIFADAGRIVYRFIEILIVVFGT